MQRTGLNLVVDLATAVAMFGMLLTGYVIRFPLPPGTNKDWMLWGMTRHEWGAIHFWISTALLALVIFHLCLHWHWVATVVRQRLQLAKPSQSAIVPDAIIVGTCLALVFVGFAWIAQANLERVSRSHTGTCPSDSAIPSEETQQKEKTSTAPTWNDVYPIFERSCLSCHGPEKQRANFRVDQPENWQLPGKSAWIVPGKSGESLLIEIVSGQREIALRGRHRLPESDVATIRRWIDAGAVNSNRAPETVPKTPVDR
jgi:hypothetical protein